MVIATEPVISHFPGAMSKPENILSPETAHEMRPEQIGRRLRLLREAIGKEKAEMADLLGMERTYWSRFEGGKRPITDAFAALLVERFGVTLDFLILGRWDKLPFDLASKMREVEKNS